jgi:hypothetical protein
MARALDELAELWRRLFAVKPLNCPDQYDPERNGEFGRVEVPAVPDKRAHLTEDEESPPTVPPDDDAPEVSASFEAPPDEGAGFQYEDHPWTLRNPTFLRDDVARHLPLLIHPLLLLFAPLPLLISRIRIAIGDLPPMPSQGTTGTALGFIMSLRM